VSKARAKRCEVASRPLDDGVDAVSLKSLGHFSSIPVAFVYPDPGDPNLGLFQASGCGSKRCYLSPEILKDHAGEALLFQFL
jgi:hypothetical protein